MAAYVESREPGPREREILSQDFALAQTLQIPVVTLQGRDIAAQLIIFARQQGVTQIVLGHSDRSRWQEFVRGSTINRIEGLSGKASRPQPPRHTR